MEYSSESEFRHGKSDLAETTQPSSQPHTTSSFYDNAAFSHPSYNGHPTYYTDSRHAQATAYGHPYYPPPEPGYTGPAFVDSQGFQQHPQQVSYAVPQTPIVVSALPVSYVSLTGAIVLSCVVFWCCGIVCGGIAFIVALIGQSSAASGDTRGAIQMRNASYGLSIAGIVIGIIIIAVVVGIYRSAARGVGSRGCYNYYTGAYYYC